MIPSRLRPFVYIILSAALFGISAPVAKLLVSDIGPVALAGLLYLGAFLGLVLLRVSPLGRNEKETVLKRSELPYLAGSIICGGVIAPILLMTGIASVTGIASSLLLNLEGVATALIAWLAFKEAVGRRTWAALVVMTAAGVLLALDTGGGETSIFGAALIVMAMALWGLDNNLTSKIASTGPQRIAMLKGLVAGTASLSMSFLLGQAPALGPEILAALLLGSLSYGVSLVLFILALGSLGPARTGAFFALGPFIGAVAAVVLLQEMPNLVIVPAGALMALGAYLLLTERHTHLHWHSRVVHEHVHEHGNEHSHAHHPEITGPHSHEHVHEAVLHEHEHSRDGEHHQH
ncbi:MAG: EamA family transporter [Methanomassiliicoccus sp.]|nr:EamA family transporter [Methanomassiliicoccus sp.]